MYEYPWRYIHLYHVYRKFNLINFPRYSGAKMKQRSNLTGRSDSSLGAMRRSGSFSFAHFYQNCVSLMSNRDASFVGVFPTLAIRGVIGTTVFSTLRLFIICIQTRISDCLKIMNRIARKSVFGFPVGSDTNGLYNH